MIRRRHRGLGRERLGRFWQRLGPGFVTGAADDDPSGIATYSQAGAHYGFSALWTMVWTFPLMASVQEISATIGRFTGAGIAGNLKRHAPRWLLFSTVTLLLFANVLNLGADIAAMAEAASLILGRSHSFFVVVIGLLSALLQVFVPYHRYVYYLKWLALSLLSYVAVLFFIHVPIRDVARDTFFPSIQFNAEYFKTIVAIFGTTLSPYLFFWQASQEVEEACLPRGEYCPIKGPDEANREVVRIRTDTYLGMFFSNAVAFAIILAAGATLHSKGTLAIESAAAAAKALEPFAGYHSKVLFALGILGTGLLAIPVLAGSAAYAMAEALGWPAGLEKTPHQARGFYALIVAAIGIGAALDFLRIPPMAALFYCAILNGILATPLMAILLVLAGSSKVMGSFRISAAVRVVGWIATFVMALSVFGLFL